VGYVVLGYDDSLPAQAALGVAIEQAKSFGDRLAIVFGDEPPGWTVGDEFREHRRALEELGAKVTDDAAREAREAGVEVETLLLPLKPATALDAVARERGARLIVVGTYGESPMGSAILGSTPHKLLHVSPTPVLCVSARPLKEQA
jgi:nucleotide-binding universal stress UspA family protein